MNATTRAVAAAASIAAAVNFAAPAYADPDTDFANQLHSYGIYGPRDTNAWIGRITCQRLNNHLDTDAHKSADFLAKNLPKGSTTAQAWQFLGAAISTYCPDNTYVLQAAAQHT
jgi:hypothetical protein